MPSKAKDEFLRIVARGLEQCLVRRDVLIVLALSGGPDSVALLHAMLALRERFGYRLAAAHLNHAIRAAESDRDEAFVRSLCARLEIELCVERAVGLSPELPNLEERARDARRAFLEAAAERLGAAHVALAHHEGDQAETVLLRLLRGAGVAGLGAMSLRGPGRFIRPMLSATRAKVLAWLRALGADFMNDASNDSRAMLRNRIRHELLPMLERDYAPGLGARLCDLSSEMRSLDDFITASARAELATIRAGAAIDLFRFAATPPALQAAVVRQFLNEQLGGLRRIERVHIDAICRLCLTGPPNGTLALPGGVVITREYRLLRVARRGGEPAQRFTVALPAKGSVAIAEAGFAFDTATVAVRLASARDASPAVKFEARFEAKFEALFDAREAGAGLLVRNFVRGDRISPIGMSGSRKLTDVFIDARVPRPKRATFPVVEVNGVIAWLPGIVRGRVAMVTEATQTLLRVRASSI